MSASPDKATVIETHSPEETLALGRRLGSLLRVGDCVGLIGPLGAGKTLLVRGVAEGARVDDLRQVGSPTFVIVNVYGGPLQVFHVDAYRISRPAELADVGIEEFGESGAVIVEWADRVGPVLADDRLVITITPTGECHRRLAFAALGRRSAALRSSLIDPT